MKKIYLLLTVAAVLCLSSCNLDINDNPNYPSNNDVTPDLVFPAAENAIATAVGDQMFNYGGFFAQYFEQRPEANQYNDEAELNLDESKDLFNRCYRTLYAGALADLKNVMDRTENKSDLFACTVMRAYAFQILVDNLDQVPYTEALQGSANSQPKWDAGQEVYEGVLAEIDAAEAALDGELMTLTDPMLNKSVDAWKGFANALRLRMYLRLIDGGINASTYQAKAVALVQANNFFTGNVAWDVYSPSEGQFNPWYDVARALGTKNHVAAYPIVSYYTATNDPRMAYVIMKAEATSDYVGQIPGAKTIYKDWGVDWKNKDVSAIDYTPVMAAPIYLFTQSELQFLIAETQMRWGNKAAAKAAYEAGVAADFASRGIAVGGFLAQPQVNWDAQASDAARLKLIYMQKWAALFMRDHMEAWSEVRRTDVPTTCAATAKQIYQDGTVYEPGQMIVPARNFIVAGGLCKRVPYPSTARQLNKNTPAEKLLSDRVFWDAK